MTEEGIRPDETVQALIRSIRRSNRLPDALNYIGYRPDKQNSDANVKLPVLTIEPVSHIRITEFNTDQVDTITQTDADGNEVTVGRVFAAEYRIDFNIAVWVASGSSYDVRNIGNNLWTALYRHDSSGPGEPFISADGTEIEGIWKVQIRDGEPHDDLTHTPSLRRWNQMVSIWAYHTFDTTEDYISSVDYPSELSGTQDDDMLSG